LVTSMDDEGNTGTSTFADGCPVHEVVDERGRDTVFSGNAVNGVPGWRSTWPGRGPSGTPRR